MSITWKTAAVRPLVGVVAGLVALTGCATAGGGSSKSDEVSVVGFSILKTANEQLLKDFQKTDAGKGVTFKTSYGASGDQSRAVIAGLDADEVHLSLEPDVTKLVDEKLVADDWKSGPNKGVVTQSVVAIVVRKGNPKGVKDWPDLVKPGISIVTPNPKTSGNGQLSLYAAWGSVMLRGGTRQQAIDYLTKLYKQVPVLDSGARAATTTFVQKRIGDVHLAWENEAQLEVKEAAGALELVYPPISIRAEPHVAVVDKNVDRKKTRAAAEAYLKFLYTPEAQEIIAQNFYRPTDPEVLKKYAKTFPAVKMFGISEISKGWTDAFKQLVGDGGVFDSIYKP